MPRGKIYSKIETPEALDEWKRQIEEKQKAREIGLERTYRYSSRLPYGKRSKKQDDRS
jgi:hypothetical protein